MTCAFYSIVYDIVFLIERKINYFILFYIRWKDAIAKRMPPPLVQWPSTEMHIKETERMVKFSVLNLNSRSHGQDLSLTPHQVELIAGYFFKSWTSGRYSAPGATAIRTNGENLFIYSAFPMRSHKNNKKASKYLQLHYCFRYTVEHLVPSRTYNIRVGCGNRWNAGDFRNFLKESYTVWWPATKVYLILKGYTENKCWKQFSTFQDY